MKNLNQLSREEMNNIQGGGFIGEAWDDIRRIINELPDAYEDAINSTTDMMCTATGNC